MQAYVVAAEPVHENSINYFAATLGFYRLGYHVDRYRLKDLPQLDLSLDTPVFGGMESISRVFPSYRSIPHFPTELEGFLGRIVSPKPFREAKQGDFIKPLEGDHKQFPAMILDDSVVATIKLSVVPPERPVYV